MKLRKVLATFLAITLVLTYTVVPVYAVERHASNENTGADSSNTATTTDTNSVEVNNENEASVDNDVTAIANTGENSASYNTGGGTVKTGNASTSVSTTTTVNTNTTTVSCTGCAGSGDSTVQNKNTGANSDNTAVASTENSVVVNNENDADVDNDVYAESNTGKNSADYNTGDALVETGNAKSNIDLTTTANQNETTIGGGAGGGSLTLRNQNTGADSENIVVAAMANGVEVTNHNHAHLDNEIDAYAYTGQNSADYNTGGGTVKTGDATIDDVFVDQKANSNETTVGGEGDGGVEVVVENMNTGYNSYNDAVLGLTNYVEVNNKNFTKVHNDIYADSDTGQNSADYNVADGRVETGDARTEVTLTGEFNSSETTLDCNSCLAVGDVTLRNKDTGAKSDNTVTFGMENSTEVHNGNKAFIGNDVEAYGYTGRNSADYNGNGGEDGSVETGNADTSVTVDDTANTSKTEFTSGNVSGMDVTVENMNTGYNSYNDATVGVLNDLSVQNWNFAGVHNDIYADSDTGKNSADYNVADGRVETGSANTEVSLGSNLNHNTTDVECPVCGLGSDVVARNKNTGASSENVAVVGVASSFSAGNFNKAWIRDEADAYAYTGENSADYNVGDGFVSTGKADAKVTVENTANYNTTETADGNGSDPERTAENMNTGYDSDNTATTDWENDVEVKNHNKLYHSSDLYADSMTGDSHADYNVGSGEVNTGKAVASTSDFTSGNVNM